MQMQKKQKVSFITLGDATFDIAYQDLSPIDLENSTPDFIEFKEDVESCRKVLDIFPLNLSINSASAKTRSISFDVKGGLADALKMLNKASKSIAPFDASLNEFVRVLVLDTSISNGVAKINPKKLEEAKPEFSLASQAVKEKIEGDFLNTLEDILTPSYPKKKDKRMVYLENKHFKGMLKEFEELKTQIVSLKPNYFFKEGSLKLDLTAAFKENYYYMQPIDKCFVAEIIMNGFKMGKKVEVKLDQNNSLTLFPYNYISKATYIAKPTFTKAETTEFTLKTYYSTEYKDAYTESSRYTIANKEFSKGIELNEDGDSIFTLAFLP